MIYTIGLGSNLGDRKANMEKAAQEIKNLASSDFKASPLIESPALVPADAPSDWRKPFLNAVIRFDSNDQPLSVFRKLQEIERTMGRVREKRWQPRIIDLDILLIDEVMVDELEVKVPHPRFYERSFTLTPLKFLCPHLKLNKEGLSEKNQNLLSFVRKQKLYDPLLMGILNLSSDSFSGDGGLEMHRVESLIATWDKENLAFIDLGAESTRPGAKTIAPDEEWARLKGPLQFLREYFGERVFRPLISVDTRYASTARKALELGIDVINDVSGLNDPEMSSVIAESSCRYVLMHSLSVPADPKVVLSAEPIGQLLSWAHEKLGILERAGVSQEQVLFDPGIGFGKSKEQSFEILRKVEELFELNLPLVIGHSRKSFMSLLTEIEPAERDPETLGVSFSLAQRGVDVLRVHNPVLHKRAFRFFSEVNKHD